MKHGFKIPASKLLFIGILLFTGFVRADETISPSLDQASLAFKSLEQMDELVELGMPALALRLLSGQQQLWPAYSPDWYAFEHKRISLLSAVEDWQGIVDQTEQLLTNAIPGRQITTQIGQWFISQQIIARLKLGQPDAALSQLRALLWSPDNNDTNLVALWRRLVIRAYLLMDADDDVRRALLRYQQDYNPDNNSGNHNNLNEDWRMLQARALLRTQRAEEAIRLLENTESELAQALRFVAAIRARPENAGLYENEVKTKLSGKKLSISQAWANRYVLYEAALQSKDLSRATTALQDLLSLGTTHSVLGEEFNVDGDDLWRLYENIGNAAGNRMNLLLGDDIAWYSKAAEIQAKNQAEALGLFTVLAFNAQDVDKQQLAHEAIVGLLAKDDNGLEIINQLYMHGSRVSSLDKLPVEVRYRLVDYALSKNDIELAARVMQSLQTPPEGEDLFVWSMRKARVLVLEGSYAAGEQVLTQTLAGFESITPEQIDQYLQVVFDLQAVKRHQRAIELFDALKQEWLNDDIRRELFFWKAESSYALEQYDRAAWLYLKSALVADQTQSELWAQSARFKAAGALTKAGLFDDAQTLYTELLRYAATDSRKAAIRQELQQIRLLRNAEKKSQSAEL